MQKDNKPFVGIACIDFEENFFVQGVSPSPEGVLQHSKEILTGVPSGFSPNHHAWNVMVGKPTTKPVRNGPGNFLTIVLSKGASPSSELPLSLNLLLGDRLIAEECFVQPCQRRRRSSSVAGNLFLLWVLDCLDVHVPEPSPRVME